MKAIVILFAALFIGMDCSGAAIANAAASQLGVPYVYGGGDYSGK